MPTVRINSEGVKLNQADFILTLMSVYWEEGRRELEAFSRRAVDSAATGPSPRNPFIDPAPVEDMSTLGGKPDRDGYELFLRQLLDATLSTPTAGTVRIHFPVLAGREICHVSVAASGRPVFARPPKGSGHDGSEFWVRVGNATRQLHGDDMLDYQDEHWG